MTQELGRLLLVPAPLDFGADAAHLADLQDALPLGVIRQAAALAHWVAESARTTRALLKRVEAVVPLAQPLQSISIVELPRAPKGRGAVAGAEAELDSLLAPSLQGHDIGLASEAGLPAIADPGAALVRRAHALGVPVTPLPGASALLLALAASGMNGQAFAFVGYLPQEPGARTARLRELEAHSRRTDEAQLIIETPYRNRVLLAAMLASLQPATRLSVSCGLGMAIGWTRSDAVAAWRTRPVEMALDLPAVFALQGGRP